ncbi:Arc family DNA-binding protein [Acetobacterium woodii]
MTVRLPKELKRLIEKKARTEGLSFNATIINLLWEALKLK